MNLKFVCLFITLALFLSCAQRLNIGLDEYIDTYKISSINRDKHASCNRFADESFRGLVWINPDVPDGSCVYLDIHEAPPKFFENENVYLQIYPFYEEEGEISFAPSSNIKTVTKFEGREGRSILMNSKLIDTYLVEAEMGLDPKYFFADYIFEICDIEVQHAGLQLVIYARTEQRDKALRVTQFLLPPFLIHPSHFKKDKGEALSAFHPFLDYQSEFKSRPSAYYDLAERMCLSTY